MSNNKINYVPRNDDIDQIRSNEWISESLKDNLYQLQSKNPDIITLILKCLMDATKILTEKHEKLKLQNVLIYNYTNEDEFRNHLRSLRFTEKQLSMIPHYDSPMAYMLVLLHFEGDMLSPYMYKHMRYVTTTVANITKVEIKKNVFISFSEEEDILFS